MVRTPRFLDRSSRRILAALDHDPRATVGGLADALGLARGTVQNRIGQLFDGATLRPHSITVHPESLGYSVRAMVTAEIDQHRFDEAIVALRDVPEVVECVAMSGDDDLMLQIVARDADHLYEVGQQILRCPGVRRTATSLVLKELIEHRMAQLLDD